MLEKGIHPTIVAESFLRASTKAVVYLTEMSTPVDLSDKASLLRAASTFSQFQGLLLLLRQCRPRFNLRSFLDCLAVFFDFGTNRCRGGLSSDHAYLVQR